MLNADVKALQQLKQLPETRHIPVYMVGMPELRQDALQAGAAGFLDLPVGDASLDGALEDVKERLERRVKRVLVVDDNDVERGLGDRQLEVPRRARLKRLLAQLGRADDVDRDVARLG